jgi:hypothetical protein
MYAGDGALTIHVYIPAGQLSYYWSHCPKVFGDSLNYELKIFGQYNIYIYENNQIDIS